MTTRRQFQLGALGLPSPAFRACRCAQARQSNDFPRSAHQDRRAVCRWRRSRTFWPARWPASWPRYLGKGGAWSRISSAPGASSRPRTWHVGSRRLQPPAGRFVACRAEGDAARASSSIREGFRADHAHRVSRPSMLVVSADSPYKTVEDLVAAAGSQPGKLNYASGGVGSAAHLAGPRWRCMRTRRGARAVQGLGRDRAVDPFGIHSVRVPDRLDRDPACPGRQGARAGGVQCAADAGLPNVPTLVEVFKTPDLAFDAWFGLWAPAGTPPEVIDYCSRRSARPTRIRPARRQRGLGSVVALSGSPAEFAQLHRDRNAEAREDGEGGAPT